jgi:TPR repeat protein
VAVSYLPLVTVVLLVGVPLLLLARGWRAFLRASAASATLLVLFLLWVYAPGWALMWSAHRGDPAAMYELARWSENHDARVGRVVLWPCQPDVLGGYAWLERAAALDHPPAVYAVGVRLKYGDHVPRPPGWAGPDGNHFPQPERGQALIDKALELGFEPPVDEQSFYWQHYRE